MTKATSKEDLRRELLRQVDEYLQTGGTVDRIARGVSGRDDPSRPDMQSTGLFQPRSEKREYVTEVIATLEQRRRDLTRPAPGRQNRQRRPRRKLLYDDFGEPLRWVWEED